MRRSLIRAVGLVKGAAARANVAAGALAPERGEAIAAAADRLAAGAWDDRLVADVRAGGGGIAVHREVDELLAREAGAALGDPVDPKLEVAASQSTADVLHTAARLAVHDEVEAVLERIDRLAIALRAAAERFDGTDTLARTCLQDALTVPARLLPDGSARALARRAGVLGATLAPLDLVVLGATVVGDGTGAPPAYREAVVPLLAEVVGRPLRAHPAPASALQHGDDLLDVSAALVGVATVAAKLAQDLRLLSSGPAGGLGELRLPKVEEGSAFFAAKNNPVLPEGVIQAAIAVEGHDSAVRRAIGRAELHLAGYDLAAAASVLDAAVVLVPALEALADGTIDGMALDLDRCRELAALAAPLKEAP